MPPADSGDIKLDRRAILGLATGAVASAAAPSFVTAAGASRPSNIVMLDAATLSDAIRRRQVSCVEVMTAYLDHIEKLNPKVNAIVAMQDRTGLLAQSEQRDQQIQRGEVMGPLHGFPLAVKDLMPVKGIRMTMGSPILKDFVPDADGIMVERLRRAGGIFIGKTNTPEFGLGSHTYNPVYGATRNAYDQSRSAGGSSGGAAVSLALRMLPVADGSDYGGSLRNPAGWNNVFGFRTSFGLVPTAAPDGWLPSMSVVGPMARNVPDLAMLLSIQAGYDARMPLSLPGDGSVFQRRLDGDLKGKRIAWSGDFRGYLPFEPGVLDTCKSALKVFESMGCHVEEAQPDYSIDAVWRAWLKLRAWQSGGSLLAYYNDPAQARAAEARSGVRSRERTEALGHGCFRSVGRANRMVSGGAAILSEVRLLRRSYRATISVRRQSALAAGDRGPKNADLPRMDEVRAAHHHERLPGACGARRIQRAGIADRYSNRRTDSRRMGLSAIGLRL